jgi:hypothetical protein
VEVAGTVFVDRRFPANVVARAIEALDAYDAVYVLESPDASPVPPRALERLHVILDAHFSKAQRVIACSASK